MPDYPPFPTRVDNVDKVVASDVDTPNQALIWATAGRTNLLAVRNGGVGDGATDDSGHLATMDAYAATEGVAGYVPRTAAGYALAVSKTLTSPLQLEGKLLLAGGVTLTINGPLSPPPGAYQVFGGAGSVVFGPGSVKEVLAAWWGVVDDGATDNTAALQAALNATPAGATCRLLDSGGGYKCTGTLTVPDHVTLACREGGAPPQDVADTGCQLRTTYVTGGAGGTPFITLGQGSKLSGVSVFHPSQTNTNPPVAYPYAISLASGKSGAALENVGLLNAYQGVQAVNHGRFVLHGLRFDCALQGILVDQCFDWPDVRDVESWVFWTGSTSDNWATYKQANLTAVTLERCDGWMADRVKVFLANVGVNLSSSGSGSSYGTWGNTQLDTVNCGILHSASADIGHDFTGLQVLAAGNATATSAIRSTGGVGGSAGSGGIRVHGGLLRGATSSASLGVKNVVDIQVGTGNAKFVFTGVNFGLEGGESAPPYVADIASASTTASIVTSGCRFLSPSASHIDLSGIAGGSTPALSFDGLTNGAARITNPNSIYLGRSRLTSGVKFAPSLPATTVGQVNTSGEDYFVYVYGGTVTGVSLTVAGTNFGVAVAGPFLVPAGATIALTYSAAPAWLWLKV